MKKAVQAGIVAWAALGLQSCVETPDRHLNRVHRENLSTGKGYAEGYRDGCASGYNLRGNKAYPYRKDALKTQQNVGYLSGWKAGQEACFEEAAEAKSQSLLTRPFKKQAELEPEGAVQGRYGEHFRTEEEREIWESLKK